MLVDKFYTFKRLPVRLIYKKGGWPRHSYLVQNLTVHINNYHKFCMYG